MSTRKENIFRLIARMGEKKFDFLEQVMLKSHDHLFPAGEYCERICINLSIKKTTYWSRVKWLCDIGFLIKAHQRGNYQLDENLLKVKTYGFDKEVKEIFK